MKSKIKIISIFSAIILLIFIGIILINNNEKQFKKVNMISGSIEQINEYKIYEFGISDNDICKSIEETVNQVINEYSESIDFEYVDVTKNISLSNIYSINSVPTFIIVDKNGDVKYRLSGSINKDELIEFIGKVRE